MSRTLLWLENCLFYVQFHYEKENQKSGQSL
jgi:hypothetical protein